MAVRKPVLRRALLAAALALAGAMPAPAQYLEAYKSGLEAIESQDWERASSLMAQAILERGEEKKKLPVRLFLRPYVPHFYLGFARFKLGDCEGALSAWAESERQGVLATMEEAEVARRGRAQCAERARQRGMEEARREARQLLSRTSIAAAALLDLAREEPARELWTRGSPSPSARHAEGLELMRQARELLATERPEEEDVARAETSIGEAGEIFAAVRADFERQVSARRLELAATDSSIEARVEVARGLLARTSQLAPHARSVRKARADLEGLVAEAQRREASPQVHLDGLLARLENSMRELERQAAAPPAVLDAAVAAYLQGRYTEVVEILSTAELAEGRARAQARLLLAASRHALYIEGGELDLELAAAAADDVRAARRADPGLRPAPRYYSPRFVAFFTQATGG